MTPYHSCWQGHIELSAVVLDGQFIEVITCGRVGRLENPFHFVPSEPPRPGTAFASQARRGPAGADGPGGGRVVITFESTESVGVMVTSSMPGWSAASASHYCAVTGRPLTGATSGLTTTNGAGGAASTAAAGGNGSAGGAGGGGGSRGGSLEACAADETDGLCHLHIKNINFSRTVDFVSLGERGLVEFVQLNALHEPQLIWYRPLLKATHPWR